MNALVLGLLAIAALAGCHREKKDVEEAPAVKIEGDKISLPPGSPQVAALTVEAAKPVEKTVISMTGRLVWDEENTVRVFCSVGGRIMRIEAKPGDTVNAGETLATMASPDFGQAQADASKAVADLSLSERTLHRVRDLFQHGAAAQKDVEAAEDDWENKKSEHQRALARLRLYGVASGTVDGMFPLKAPIAGVVVEKSINPGQEVRPDQMLANDAKLVSPLFVISTPSRLSVLLDITELEIANLKAGMPLEIHSRAYPNRAFTGRIEYIGESLDPLTRTVKARGFVDNSDGLLKAEMYVGVDVVDGGENAPPAVASAPPTNGAEKLKHPSSTPPVEIAVRAVFSKDNRHFVFVEKGPGKFERRPVELGVEHAGWVAVTDGLAPGDRIVTEGSLQLQAMTEGGSNN